MCSRQGGQGGQALDKRKSSVVGKGRPQCVKKGKAQQWVASRRTLKGASLCFCGCRNPLRCEGARNSIWNVVLLGEIRVDVQRRKVGEAKEEKYM